MIQPPVSNGSERFLGRCLVIPVDSTHEPYMATMTHVESKMMDYMPLPAIYLAGEVLLTSLQGVDPSFLELVSAFRVSEILRRAK